MKLIVDAGATGCDWGLINQNNKEQIFKFRTSGINMNYLNEFEIKQIIETEVFQELSKTSFPYSEIQKIYFYGSGCSTPQKKEKMTSLLRLINPNAAIISDHDMLGAAISISQGDKMVVCILGTGSNTCFYDGNNIKKNILSLGYILGDEGSGTYIGMKFLQLLLKDKLPKEIAEQFFSKYKKNKTDIIAEIYSAKKMGSYFAQYTYFVAENIENFHLDKLVKNCFRDFYNEQVQLFEEAKKYPIGFVGSIAHIFEEQLRTVGNEFQFNITKIQKNPIDGLISYFSTHE